MDNPELTKYRAREAEFASVLGLFIIRFNAFEGLLFQAVRIALSTTERKTAAIYYQGNFTNRLKSTNDLLTEHITSEEDQGEWAAIFKVLDKKIVPKRNLLAHGTFMRYRRTVAATRPAKSTSESDYGINWPVWEQVLRPKRARPIMTARQVTDLINDLEALLERLNALVPRLKVQSPTRPIKAQPHPKKK